MFGKIYLFVLNLLRSNKIITFFIWDIQIKKYCHSNFWDLTTLVIKKELDFTNKILKVQDLYTIINRNYLFLKN